MCAVTALARRTEALALARGDPPPAKVERAAWRVVLAPSNPLSRSKTKTPLPFTRDPPSRDSRLPLAFLLPLCFRIVLLCPFNKQRFVARSSRPSLALPDLHPHCPAGPSLDALVIVQFLLFVPAIACNPLRFLQFCEISTSSPQRPFRGS